VFAGLVDLTRHCKQDYKQVLKQSMLPKCFGKGACPARFSLYETRPLHYILQNGTEFHTDALMSVPAGVKPGKIHNVLGKSIHFAPGAEQVIFFVAEVTFANGDHWTAKKKDLRTRTADPPMEARPL